MVYIYKKTKGTNTYYYLRASVRKGDKIQTKDIAYLGNDPAQLLGKLKTLPATYASKIRKSYKTIERFLEANYAVEKIKEAKPRRDDYLGAEYTIKVEACKYHYEKLFSQLDETTKEEQWQNIAVELAFNTTAIEGNTITLEQAGKLLLEERTPKNKTLREIHDVKNTNEVFHKLLAGEYHTLDHETIQRIHADLLSNVDERTGYRNQEIRVFKSRFDATPAPYIRSDMDVLLGWYKKHQDNLHPLVLAILFHHKFEKIHPFMDGNGRTGRMLANRILLARGYPPLIITKKQRETYLRALNKADKADLNSICVEDYTALTRFAAEEYVKGYWHVFL